MQPPAQQFLILADSLPPTFSGPLKALAVNPDNGLELLPARVDAYNARRPHATRESRAELFYGCDPKDLEKNLARLRQAHSATVVSSLTGDTGENVMSLFGVLHELREQGVQDIRVVLPWLAFDRQDRPFTERAQTAVMVKMFLELLQTLGVKKVVLGEVHSKTGRNFCIDRFGAQNVAFVSSTSLFNDYLKNCGVEADRFVQGSPDGGGEERALSLIRAFHAVAPDRELTPEERAKWFFGMKKRHLDDGNHQTQASNFIGDVAGKIAVEVDDGTDSGGTLANGGNMLKDHDASEVWGCVSNWWGDADSLANVLLKRTGAGARSVDRLIFPDISRGLHAAIETLALRSKPSWKKPASWFNRQFSDIRDRVILCPAAPLYIPQILKFTPGES